MFEYHIIEGDCEQVNLSACGDYLYARPEAGKLRPATLYITLCIGRVGRAWVLRENLSGKCTLVQVQT